MTATVVSSKLPPLIFSTSCILEKKWPVQRSFSYNYIVCIVCSVVNNVVQFMLFIRVCLNVYACLSFYALYGMCTCHHLLIVRTKLLLLFPAELLCSYAEGTQCACLCFCSLVQVLLDEIVCSSVHRCVDPVMMEPSVSAPSKQSSVVGNEVTLGWLNSTRQTQTQSDRINERL